MTKRTCTIEGCAKAHRARGLCASHYNARHQPNRHAKKLVSCAYCGKEALKQSGGGRKYGQVCSIECRTNLRLMNHQPASTLRCELPSDHWALWYGKTSAWPRYGWSSCDQCGTEYAPTSVGTKYCSKRCLYTASDRRRGVRSVADIEAEVRQCAWCNGDYNSPHAQRVHCSDLCRENDRESRGVGLYHGWISDAHRIALYLRDDYVCWICNKVCDLTVDAQRHPDAPTLDHIVPRSKGGGHEPSNLRTACRDCNSRRGDRDAELFSKLSPACG